MNPRHTLLVLLIAAGLSGCATAPPKQGEMEPESAPAEITAGAPAASTGEAPSASAAVIEPEPSDPIRITLVGDIMLGGSADEFMQRHGHDYAFAGVAGELARADVLFGNLEGPLTDGGEPAPDKKYRFRTPPSKVAPALARAGFDVVSLANNHTLDYGATGLFDTETALFDAGIRAVGAGRDLEAARRATIVERDGHRVGFLAYSNTFPESFWAAPDRPGTAFGHRAHVEADVRALRPRVDTVVVSFHWGREATTDLRPYQPMLARAAIDAGADIVAGHHPHVLQGVERHGDGIIFYSLGNFTFGSYSENARVSAIAHVTAGRHGLHDLELVPINVYNPDVLFRPLPLTGAEAASVVEHLQSLSKPLDTPLAQDDGRARLPLSGDSTASRTPVIQ
jgi:poly-gamma-glutamate synthesis protein (capsule biosynthesis protein)